MLCYQCGTPISDQAQECPNCGAPVKRRATSKIELPSSSGLAARYTQKLRAVTAADRRLFEQDATLADRYMLGKMLGRGPFGQVFEAHDFELDMDLAVKILHKELFRDAADRERFEEALRQARAMTQKNVVRVHDHGFHEGYAWISLQHLEGLTLTKLMRLRASKGEGFELDEIDQLVSQLIAALGHIHRSYAHGDLKPENILYLPDVLKVTDHFVVEALPRKAVASRLEDSSYLAPELRNRDGEVAASPRSDIYSLGVLLGRLLFGEGGLPAAGEAGEAGDEPAHEEIAALCRQATSTDPQDRPASLEDFGERLAAAIDAGQMHRPAAPSGAPAAPPKAPPGPAPTGESSEPQRPPAPPKAPPGPTELDTPELTVEQDEEAPEEVKAPAEEASPIGLAESSAPPLEEAEAPSSDASVEPEPAVSLGEESSGVLDELPEDEIETMEVSRTGKPELGDLLPTNDVDRARIPVSEAPRLEASEETKTMVESGGARAAGGDAPEEGGIPNWVIAVVVVSLSVIAVAIIVFFQKDKEEVVLGDDGQAAAKAEAPDKKKNKGAHKNKKKEGAAGEARRARGPSPVRVKAAVRRAHQRRQVASAAGLQVAGARAQQLAAEGSPDMGQSPEALAVNDAGSPTDAEERGQAGQGASRSPAGPEGAKKPPRKEQTPKPPKKKDEEEPKPGAGTDCPQGMTLVRSRKQGNVCIDRYEQPGRGRKPKTRVSWFDAKKACEGRGARLCSRAEWSRACGGAYPWGSKWDANKCNTADEDGFERSLAAAGSQKSCRSSSGAYDMVGNVFEWTAEKRIVGGSFNSGEDVASCRYSSAKAPSSSSGDIGYRCCAGPS